jgi:SsrA-binding protein
MMAKKQASDNIVCRNRKALHRYQVIERIECGIALTGTEIKSVRNRGASIEESYAAVIGDELWLLGAHIAAYRFGHVRAHEPTRRRKLLAHRYQIQKLRQRVEQKGLTIVPLDVHFNERGIAKVTLGIVQGKKLADKRQSLKARDDQREMQRATRRRR